MRLLKDWRQVWREIARRRRQILSPLSPPAPHRIGLHRRSYRNGPRPIPRLRPPGSTAFRQARPVITPSNK